MARYQRPEQPKPVGTIVGVVVALVAVVVFMILLATGVISPRGKEATAPAASGKGVSVAPKPGQPAVNPAVVGAAPGQGIVRFSGRCDRDGDIRKIETFCSSCGKPAEAGIPKCPLCGANLKWTEKVKCQFCHPDKPGTCGVCKGTGECPFCGKMLYGMRPPCKACNRAGKCPGCAGAGKCGFCEGGFYSPGKTPLSKPPQKTEPTPPEVKPETPPAEGATPTPAPTPDPAPAPAAGGA